MHCWSKFRFTSITTRITLLCTLVGFSSPLIVATWQYEQTTNIALHSAQKYLLTQTKSVKFHFSRLINNMVDDVKTLAQLPPITGIIRSKDNNDMDPLDGSTYQNWKERLEIIFTSMLKVHPYYSQVRYINAKTGQELIRVNQGSDKTLTIVEDNALQNKSREPYFQKGLQLKPGEFYLSDITYNREHGKVTSDKTPMIRAIYPVFDGDTLWGLLIINTDYQRLVVDTITTIGQILTEHSVFSFDQFGSYAEYNPDSKQTSFRSHKDSSLPLPYYADLANNTRSATPPDDHGEMVSILEVNINDPNINTQFFVGVKESIQKLITPYKKIYFSGLWLLFSTSALFLGIAVLMVNKLVQPLNNMALKISTTRNYEKLIHDMPTHRRDETGELARAFTRMIKNINEKELNANAILSNISDGIIMLNNSGNIESCNPATCQLFGLDETELKGITINEIIPGFMEPGSCLDDHQIKGREIIELRGLHANHTSMLMELTLSHINTISSSYFIMVARDISERKLIEESKEKDIFISTINHELRTPLTSIQGALKLLSATILDKLDEKSGKLLTISTKNTERLKNLVDDILDAEKIAAGKMQYFLETTEINSLAEDIINRHQMYAEKYQITFKLNKSPAPLYSMVDKNRFNQALVNLLSNGARFSPIHDEVTIQVFTTEEDGMNKVCISVSDNGPGIPLSFRNKVFDKFTQAESSLKYSKGGSGLGLNISRSIVEALGGTLTFKTKKNAGTTFIITLPAIDSDKA